MTASRENVQPSPLQIHEFYIRNNCRLFECPGDRKHPAVAGYSGSQLLADTIQSRLNKDHSIRRYCWLHGFEHLILDVDRHGIDDGWASLHRLGQTIGVDLVKHSQHRLWTPDNDGMHLAWLKPVELPIRSLTGMVAADGTPLYPGIDTLGRDIRSNSLTIGASSWHPKVPGRYSWDDSILEPNLIPAPEELLRYLERPAKEFKSGSLGDPGAYLGKPGYAFMMSQEGVETLAAVMSDLGYLFHPTFDEDGVAFYEFKRPDKSSGSRVSGFLGKQSEQGVFQLTSFSHADPLFPQINVSITIYEAMCQLLNEGRGTEDPDAVRVTLKKLDSLGFGRPTATQAFGEVQPFVPPEPTEAAFPTTPVPELPPMGVACPTPKGWFSNGEQEADSGDGKGKPKAVAAPVLVHQIKLSGQLKSVAGQLVAIPGKGKVQILQTVSDLFAWLHFQSRVSWYEGPGFVTKSEFFGALVAGLDRYDSLSTTPHFPPVEGVLYINPVSPGNTQDLYDFINHFSPESNDDWFLLLAALVTPFWGDGCGQKPAFLIGSQDAQGAGKSTFVDSISRLIGWGRQASLSITGSTEDFRRLATTLGSQSPTNPIQPRIISVDNIKSATFGGAMLESWLTAEYLTLNKHYVGSVEIRNLFVWYLTANHIDMTEDFAQRTVEARIRKPDRYSTEWVEKLRGWDLGKVIAGIAAFFQLPVTPISESTRFPLWCSEILGRIGEPADGLVRTINKRTKQLSLAEDDAEEVHDILMAYLSNLVAAAKAAQTAALEKGITQDWQASLPWAKANHIWIQKKSLAYWLNGSVTHPCPIRPGRWTSHNVGRMLAMNVQKIPPLSVSRDTAKRGFIYDVTDNPQLFPQA